MGNKIELAIDFSPSSLKAFTRNEARMEITFTNISEVETFWNECEIHVSSPLSLAHDTELNTGRTKVGITRPHGKIKKTVMLYTRPNNYPDDYAFTITAFVYDEDGAIAERIEQKASIKCVAEETSANAGAKTMQEEKGK